MLNSIFNNTITSVQLLPILLCVVLSVVYGVIIALTYKFTSKYNKNFLICLSLLPLIVSIVIIMVNGNLGTSVAVLGAFSLIRFRSLPGTSKEILSVFFAMAIGLCTGMGFLGYGAIFSIIGSIFMIVFSKVSLFDISKSERILRIVIPEDLDYSNVFNEIFDKYTKKVSLEQVKTTNMGSLFDLTYRIELSKDINEKEFIDELRVRNGNLKIILTHPVDDNNL
ncbi:MAG: DUF4956 domain-containing protein [Bacilli bacterium]|nr:DUF4956 domain-containing protein [Bacilli bacterium]